MTQTQHTPEFWEPHAGLDYACVMLPGETTETASISVHTDCPEERDRLLAMIAAAPEALAALIDLRNECSGTPRPHMLIPMLEAADKAIAKARVEASK